MMSLGMGEGPEGLQAPGTVSTRCWAVSSVAEAEKILVEFEAMVNHLPELTVSQLLVSACEALNNALEHGIHFSLDKKAILKVTLDEERVEMIVEDDGEGFEPKFQTELRPAIRSRGWGLPVIAMSMDHVEWTNQGKRLIMVKYIE